MEGGEDEHEHASGEAPDTAARARQAWRVQRMVERVPGECLQRRWVPGYENSVSYVLSGKVILTRSWGYTRYTTTCSTTPGDCE